MEKLTFRPMPFGSVKLLPGIFQQRADLNRRYLMSLENQNLLQNFYMEAGLWSPPQKPENCHWGWESPTCQVRGHFLGHWLSAAAHIYANTGDTEIKAKADAIVSGLGRCQEQNGGEWAGSIPEKYLEWISRGKPAWAPHYTLQKTLMGLYEMAAYAGNEQAMNILVKWARWFNRWTKQFSREQMDNILDFETGGMLELWANLYGLTRNDEHLELIKRYDRPRLFNRLLAGEDPLTNYHANTTIPEAQGAARAWEVTGELRWKQIAQAYWDSAVTHRGYYATGGQTNGEIWSPPFKLSSRLGDKTQEHCTVYNMMRLADYLLRWDGEVRFADYWERNLYNGVLAQQNPDTGMITYFLPLRAGSRKKWGTPTNDFWCCHGTLVQAHTIYPNHIYYENDDGLVLCQYIPNELTWKWKDVEIHITLQQDGETETTHRPDQWCYHLKMDCAASTEFSLKIRLPWWISGKPLLSINGEALQTNTGESGYLNIKRLWSKDSLRICLPKRLMTEPLPHLHETVAFMDGPVVLAGLCDEERTLYGDVEHPDTLLIPDNEREWSLWRPGFRTKNQPINIRFIPLYEIRDESYTVYFPIKTV